MSRPPGRLRSFLIERRLYLSCFFHHVPLNRSALSPRPDGPQSSPASFCYSACPLPFSAWPSALVPAAAFGHAVLVGRCAAPLGSVPSLLPSIPPPPRSVLIICHATLALQANSHWFPFLSWPALICDATAVPLTRLIGHCPLRFQLPSLLPLSLSFSLYLSLFIFLSLSLSLVSPLPTPLKLVPLRHPPPVV